MNFTGVKVAILCDGKLVMQLRDNKPAISFPNMWDFLGGGREGEESPLQCALREIEEETTLRLTEKHFVWSKEYPAMHDARQRAYCMTAVISKEESEGISLTEGQRWDFMSTDDFFTREDVVPHLKGRFQDYLDSQ